MAREEIKALLSTTRPDCKVLKASTASQGHTHGHSSCSVSTSVVSAAHSYNSFGCRGFQDSEVQRGCLDAASTLAHPKADQRVGDMQPLQDDAEQRDPARRDCSEKDAGPSRAEGPHSSPHVQGMQARALEEMREVMRSVIASCPLSPVIKETGREQLQLAVATVKCGYDAQANDGLLYEKDLQEFAVSRRLQALMAPVQALLNDMEEQRKRPRRKHTETCSQQT